MMALSRSLQAIAHIGRLPFLPAAASLLLAAGCGRPGPEAIRGIDVSHHQGPIDWPKVKAQGMRFAYVKAAEGESWLDTMYSRNLAEARAAGILAGSYHFFSFCKGGLVQARNFLSKADLRAGDLIPALDVETAGNCADRPEPGRLYREVKAFLDAVESATGRRPLIYTTYAFHFRHMGPEFASETFWLRNLLWKPGTGVTWAFWQYAVDDLPGVDGAVDRNVFAWGPERLAEFILKERAPGAVRRRIPPP